MEQLAISSINVEDMAGIMTNLIDESIQDIDEIRRTNPIVNFNLGRDKSDKLILVASVTFPEDEAISPMDYAERLIAVGLIKTLVSKKMKTPGVQ